MADIAAKELNRLDEAFAGNRLLATLSAEDRPLIERLGEMVELRTGQTVLDRGDVVRASLFPVGPTMISLAIDLSGGRTVEAALIGRRGAVGGIISCGEAPAFTRAIVLVGGPALWLPMDALEKAKRESPFIGNLFCRYSDYLLSMVMQSVACNAFHPIEQRSARWLLHAQDRTGDRIALTQQALANLLGVQRTTVNAVVQSLENQGLITTGRGVIRVVDRPGLKRASCECYQRLEDHYSAVILDHEG
jgi:DNA-binding transcriptional regulator YhcF (GntR family)